MARIASIFLILAAAVVAALGSVPALAAEKRATLRLINPEISVNGMRIKHIVAMLDGRDFGECWGDRRQPGDVCIKSRPIEPGPHVLELVLDPIATTYFRSVDTFNAGMNGEWTLDLKGLAVDGAKTSDYLSLFQGLQPVEGCRAALERLASMSSCTIDEFGALGPAFAEALGQCGKSVPDGGKDEIEAAFSAVVDNHFSLDLARCRPRAEIEKLPAEITAFGRPYDGWPLGRGSWRWARNADVDLSAVNGLAVALEKLQAELPAMAKRVTVVDSIIDAFLSRDAAPVFQAAMNTPFSLDAETPEGQRNLLLLSNARYFYDARYADFIAEGAAKDRELDCARNDWEAKRMIDYFKEKGSLSAAAVNAMLAMAARVPRDMGQGACGSVIDLHLESPVDAAERLRRFFALDCAETRAPQQRGSSLVAFLGTEPRTDDADLRQKRRALQQQLRPEFAQCLGESQRVAAAAINAGALAEAAKRGCKIGPNATCSRITLRRADLHGADLNGAKLDEATLEEADLKGANLAGADLKSANLDNATLTGVTLDRANLEQIYARKTDLHGLDFTGTRSMRAANLSDSDLKGANFAGVTLAGARLAGADLTGANLAGADLSGAMLEMAHLRGSDLRHAKLDGARLKNADLTGAKLEGASLREAMLSGAILKDAALAGADLARSPLDGVTWLNGCKLAEKGSCAGIDLHGLSLAHLSLGGIDLSGANLAGADLSFAWLEGADLHGADLRGANVQQTIFRGANLAGANLTGSEGGSPQFDGADMSETILRDGKKCAPGAKVDRLHDC
jgi:uncharacterized protein YjbI with pentapeptide repeats